VLVVKRLGLGVELRFVKTVTIATGSAGTPAMLVARRSDFRSADVSLRTIRCAPRRK